MAHFVGSSKPLALSRDVVSTAVYGGPDDCYRYELLRVWDQTRPRLLWIMMNPSLATEHQDDRSVALCQKYARKWGFGSMYVGNSFAYRCTDQNRLNETPDPEGPENRKYLLKMAKDSDRIILAFGTPKPPALQKVGLELARELSREGLKLHVLGLTRAGRPIHPLYYERNNRELPLPTPWQPS